MSEVSHFCLCLKRDTEGAHEPYYLSSDVEVRLNALNVLSGNSTDTFLDKVPSGYSNFYVAGRSCLSVVHGPSNSLLEIAFPHDLAMRL
jgi:hypothetical protein